MTFSLRHRPHAEDQVNYARFVPAQRAGHYESFFQRANHPTRPLAFWIRYTLFSPQGHPHDGMGELWAIVFNGETGTHVVVKREVPIADASFSRNAFRVTVADAFLGGEGTAGKLSGAIASSDHQLAWDLCYQGGEPPLFLYPPGFYRFPWPKAKSLVGVPLAVYEGMLRVDGRTIDVRGWVGSQNHNWGSRHTDRYAWGQVAGFDDHPRSFLEVATAYLRVGPLWTPPLTPLVLRHGGREHALRSLAQCVRAEGEWDNFQWQFCSETPAVRVEGRMWADPDDFVGLRYRNPPGGIRYCLNTNLASCDLTVTYRSGALEGQVDRLQATRRAAFESLTEEQPHRVPLRA